jgi:hypothetical protein
MTYSNKSSYVLAMLFTITSHTIMCMEDHTNKEKQEEPNKEKEDTFREKQNAFKEKMAQAKENTYIRDNSIQYRMASTTGHQATKAFMGMLAQTVSGSIVEVVRRELDIRYDNSPTVGRQLEEIASGITIIHNAVNLTDELAKKETAMAKYITNNDLAEQKRRLAEIDNDTDATFKGLRHLRNAHINDLNKIRQKRDPNFKPYSAQ